MIDHRKRFDGEMSDHRNAKTMSTAGLYPTEEEKGPEKRGAAKSLAPFGMTAKKQAKPEEKEEILKRPFDVIYSWVTTLSIPIDSYELLYRLGQKHDEFFATKVEYYAPYLLKDGMVQRIRHFADDSPGILVRSSTIFCDDDVFLYY